MTTLHTSSLKAYFLSGANFKDQFEDSKSVLPINFAETYFDSEYLVATINLINSYFRECNIIICDTLQRYVLALLTNELPENLLTKANKSGKEWLEKNHKIIKKMTIPYQITYWNDWLTHPNYQLYYNKIGALYAEDKNFQTSMNSSINNFIERYKSRANVELLADTQKIFNLGLQYIKEECAVTLLWAEERTVFEIHPDKMSQALLASYSRLVMPYKNKTLKYLQLGFRRIKVASP